MSRHWWTVVVAGLLAASGLLVAPVAGSTTASMQQPVQQPGGDSGSEGLGRVMLLLDSSGSMAEPAGGGQTKIAAARSALTTVVDGLPQEAQVGLRVFGATVFSRDEPGSCTDSQLVVEPGVDNRDALREAVSDYEPYGETPIPHALREAAADLGEEGQRSIVLVSDGESTCDPDPCVVAEELTESGIDLRIDVVGLSVSGRAREQLQCIADRGEGTYYDADSAADIESRLNQAAQRALRPFVLTGTPVQGGPETDPTEVGVGDWTDTLGMEGAEASRSYWVEKETEGSTLRVSAITQGEDGDEGLDVTLTGPDGEECDAGAAVRLVDTREIVGVQAIAGPVSDCVAAGRYRITVARNDNLSDQAPSIPVGLRVVEEPPLAEPLEPAQVEVEVAEPTVSGTPSPVVGGASFANATPIGQGRWASTVVPGEALMYRIPLEFGQAARIRVRFAAGTAAMREVYRSFPPLGQIVLYNPMQAQLAHPSGAEFSGNAGDTEPVELVTATAPVDRSLIEAAGYNGVEDYSVAGDYYLAVSVRDEDHSVELPFTVDVEVVGEPTDGPAYADGASWSLADAVAGIEDEPDAEPTDPAAPGEPAEQPGTEARGDDEGSAGTRVAAGVGLGALGVLAVVGAMLVWRRRRTT